MKLDTRIMDGKKPLNCFDTEEAESYVGKECYFSNDVFPFANMSDKTNRALIYKGSLLKVWPDGSDPYETDSQRFYTFCLPCEWVTETKEKQYRPYTIDEFCNEGFEIIVFRERDYPSMEYHVRYNGYRKCDNVYKVILGNISYTLSDLFEDFEFLDSDGEWKPFGVKEE